MHKPESKILLVEDDRTLQYVFGRQVKRLGFEGIDIVDNGLSAVERVLERPYQLVFMDVRLPGIDGITATNQIRCAEESKGQHTTIVGLTAFAERQRCLDAGMDDFLQKPVLLEQLQEVFDKWLRNKSLIENNLSIVVEAKQRHDFVETDAKLKAIEDKIANLRRSVGLD